jgi:Arc/MetJ family transcription regulator
MLDDAAQRSWHFKQLRWSLHRLAAAGSEQPVLFPDFVESPDDLAFHFDHWGALVRSEYADALAERQVTALDAIERKLATMSRDGVELDADLWTETALRTSVDWADVRQLAAAALEAFGWTDQASDSGPCSR